MWRQRFAADSLYYLNFVSVLCENRKGTLVGNCWQIDCNEFIAAQIQAYLVRSGISNKYYMKAELFEIYCNKLFAECGSRE